MSSQLLAPTSHLHTARHNSQGRLNHHQGTGLDLESSVWRDSRAEFTSGLWFRLRYSQSESPQTTNTLTLLEIPESTVYFGLPSHPTHTETNRAEDCNDQRLGLVRSLGLAESNSADLMRGGRFRLKSHAHDICSQVTEWCP